MASRIVKQVRCEDALRLLSEGGEAVFFTLTTEDAVDLPEIRRRWRSLRNWLVRRLGNPRYVMNFEKHPGYLQKVVKDKDGRERVIRSDGKSHGWHIHSVFSRFIPLNELQSQIRAHGFGRVDVRRVTSRGISDYLTKHALKAYRGLSRKERERYPKGRLRLVNTSRGLPPLSSYSWQSDFLSRQRKLYREYHDMRTSQGFKPDARLWLPRCAVLSLLGASSFTEWHGFWMGLVDGHFAKAAKGPKDGVRMRQFSLNRSFEPKTHYWAKIGANEPSSLGGGLLQQGELDIPTANPRPLEQVAVGDYEERVSLTATKRKRSRARKFSLPCHPNG